jgi:hypothetical protein
MHIIFGLLILVGAIVFIVSHLQRTAYSANPFIDLGDAARAHAIATFRKVFRD